MLRFKDLITEVPDFPIDGVNFKDISPLLADEGAFDECIEGMGEMVEIPEYWVGIDARGFIFASALSIYFGGGVVLCRKAGKLPPPTARHEYKTEYSEDVLEMKIGTGSVVVVDDVLATGGTLQAVNDLCQTAGYNVIDNLVLIDLQYVPRVKDFNLKIRSLIQYEN
jgi:adenine phosphoribosyltransferase|tara:strand:- start:250 stop:750 length:501 start_codon:yes stop_codon:yes gene_type:complete